MWISKGSAKEMGSVFVEVVQRRPKRYLLDTEQWVTELTESDTVVETEYEYMVEYASGSQDWIVDVMDTAFSKIKVSDELAWNTVCDYCGQAVGSCEECVSVNGSPTRQHRYINFGSVSNPRT